MAIIKCKIHGRAGLLPICDHLYHNMIENVYPNTVNSIVYYFGDFGEDENSPMIMGFLYCSACAEQYKLPKGDNAVSKDREESAPWDSLKSVCEKCFDEYLLRHKVVWKGLKIPDGEIKG